MTLESEIPPPPPPVQVHVATAGDPRGHPFAGFLRRLAAFLIDAVLLGTVEGMLALFVQLIAPNDLLAQANVLPISSAVAWAYFALLESSPAQATVGKFALGIYVTDRNGDPITFRRASFRHWAKTLSTLTFMCGWLMAAVTPRKRALHDIVAGTLVLSRSTVPLVPLVNGVPAVAGEHWDGTRWLTGSASGHEAN
jgi:uncharacterized RDD family membrane protein YckC